MARPRKYFAEGVWWSSTGDDYDHPLHSRVFAHVKALEQDQRGIHLQNQLNARLYTNRELMTYEWNGAATVSFQPLSANTDNVIRAVIETVVALIGKNRPKATPIARAADFDVYLRARQLDRWLWGEFEFQEVWTKGIQVFEDGVVFGTGLLKHEIDGDEIYTERVNPDEIIVDQRECMSCREPMQLHQRKAVSRLWLLGKYPALKDQILEAPAIDYMQYTAKRAAAEDQILLIESWKLPIDGSPGKHAICIETATLLEEPYTRDWFPFTDFMWTPPLSGWYGRSGVEVLIPHQIKLNKLNRDIEMGQHIMCTPQIWMQAGNGVVATQLDDTFGRIIKVRGEVPQPKVWNAFSPEIYNERQRIRDLAFNDFGVSELSSQAKAPSGWRADSSEALREMNMIENERFARQAQAYEDFYLRVARRLVQLAAELYKGKEVDRKHAYRSRYLVQQINWSDVDLEADKYCLQISASSILNMSPAARRDKLNEWAAGGVITQQEYKAMSGQPDLERMADLMAAPHDYAEFVVDKLLSAEDVSPDPLSDLNLLFKTVHDTYLHLRSLDCDEEILQGFRDFLMLTEKLLNPPPDPTMAPPPSAPGMPPDPSTAPPGMPTATPVNDMTGAPAPSVSTPLANAFVG